jgi:hypothetical protein
MTDSRQDFPDDVNTVPAEDGTTWVEIASTGTGEEATLLAGFLEAEGIPAQIENVKFQMEPINFGAMGEIRVYVPGEHEARAQQLLRERNQQYEQLSVDGETVVTQDGPATVEDNAQVEGTQVDGDDGSRT